MGWIHRPRKGRPRFDPGQPPWCRSSAGEHRVVSPVRGGSSPLGTAQLRNMQPGLTRPRAAGAQERRVVDLGRSVRAAPTGAAGVGRHLEVWPRGLRRRPAKADPETGSGSNPGASANGARGCGAGLSARSGTWAVLAGRVEGTWPQRNRSWPAVHRLLGGPARTRNGVVAQLVRARI